MNKNTIIANGVTVGGIGLCLAIAQLPFSSDYINIRSYSGRMCIFNKKDK